MKEIQLTKGLVALVDDEDFERVNKLKWYAGGANGREYAVRRDGRSGPMVMMHRFILGVTDKELQVDHKNHVRLDNTRSNIRVATKYQNAQNQYKKSNTLHKYRGIKHSHGSGRFDASICANGKYYSLGTHDSPE